MSQGKGLPLNHALWPSVADTSTFGNRAECMNAKRSTRRPDFRSRQFLYHIIAGVVPDQFFGEDQVPGLSPTRKF